MLTCLHFIAAMAETALTLLMKHRTCLFFFISSLVVTKAIVRDNAIQSGAEDKSYNVALVRCSDEAL